MGKFSRTKGRRVEQQLVLYLKRFYYAAERILRQYQQAGQADVKATKNNVTYTFEMKARRANFKTIYDLYYAERDANGLVTFVIGANGTPCAMSTHFPDMLRSDWSFRNLEKFPPNKFHMKVYNRIVRLNELRQTADFLVIKDNGKPMLFLRYW